MSGTTHPDPSAYEPWVERASDAIEQKLAATRAPILRLFHVALVRSLEEKAIPFPPTESGGRPVGYAARHFLTRIANELSGVVGCLYWGSPLSALHHVRALMELAACAQHLHPSNDPASLERRWRRLQEFEDAARAAQYERDAAADGIVPYAAPTSRFAAADVAFFNSKRAEWCKLYDLKGKLLAGLTHWHQPRTIKNLFEVLPEEHWALYGHVCNCCHFSPLGERLGKAPRGGYPLFVTHEEPVNRVVDLAIEYTALAVRLLDEVTPLPRAKELLALLPT